MSALPATSRAPVAAAARSHSAATLVIRWSLGSDGDWIECSLECTEHPRATVTACTAKTVRTLASGTGTCAEDAARALRHVDIPGVLTATFREAASVELLYARSPLLLNFAGGQAGVPTLRCAATA